MDVFWNSFILRSQVHGRSFSKFPKNKDTIEIKDTKIEVRQMETQHVNFINNV